MFLTSPPRLDEAGWEQILASASSQAAPGPEGLDLRGLAFIDPYGLLGLLAIGCSSDYRQGQAWGLILPRDRGVRSFLNVSGALSWLENFFILSGADAEGVGADVGERSDPPLLEVKCVRDVADVHRAVAKVKGRTDRLLIGRLGYNSLAADRFTVALAEICQNIVDHSASDGFVMAQYYRPGRKKGMVCLAVVDTGLGVRQSLADRYGHEYPGSWDDRRAVRLAFRRGVSRFDEPGRGLGLKLVAEMVRGWGGRLLLRSGTAAYAISPSWGPRPRRGNLPLFPGTQINIFLPSLV